MKSLFSAFSMFLLANLVVGVLSDGEATTTETTANASLSSSSSKSTPSEPVKDDPNAAVTAVPTRTPDADQSRASPPLVHDITAEVTTTTKSNAAALPDATKTVENNSKAATPDKKNGKSGVSRVIAELAIFGLVVLVISRRFS